MNLPNYNDVSDAKLIAELLELEDQKRQNDEDTSLYAEYGQETDAKYLLVRQEILRRMERGASTHVPKPKEILRVHNVMEGENLYTTQCIVCGKELNLWYNGGELDQSECCGHVYELEHGPLDFVVRKK